MSAPRDHGGGIDAAAARWGGRRADWLDLSTGINPVPYPLPPIPADAWTALPDSGRAAALEQAARRFWAVPAEAAILAAPGVSVLIANLPRLARRGRVRIAPPTYNEHAAAFRAEGWEVVAGGAAEAQVAVQPNNPDGRLWPEEELRAGHAALTVIDESFCDVCPEHSLVALAAEPGVIVLKGLGKFWGLAGLRLGFAIARPETIARLAEMLGPWPVSGPAQVVGAVALSDTGWAEEARARLARDAARLDALMAPHVEGPPRGTALFRLYKVPEAAALHERLARARIWSRVFPWSGHALRLGLPGSEDGWQRLARALE